MDENPKQQPQQPPQDKPSFFSKGLLFWALMFSLVFIFFWLTQGGVGGQKALDFDKFVQDIEAGHVKTLTVHQDHWEAELRQPKQGESWPHGKDVKNTRFESIYEPDSVFTKTIMDTYRAYNERTAGSPQEQITFWDKTANIQMKTLFLSLLPWILIGAALYFFVFRFMRGPDTKGILSFGKSRAKLMVKEHTKITFDDVAGIDEAKEEVQEIVAFLKNPEKFRRLGGRLPRGILLVGRPGTGKTLLAKAIAGEADTPFFSISGSDFVEMFVGVGASRVRDLFAQAKASSPCIIFLDEIDAVGRERGTGMGGGHDEREQTLNAVLVEMDGFDTDDSVIVIAATNRPDVLDPALLRPGRFDRQVTVDLPDLKGREAILRVHAKKVKMNNLDDLKEVARSTPGFSGADLENLINEGAILATMRDRESVTLNDLEEARDRVMWGREKKSRVMDEYDRKLIAFHEAGHAIVSHMLPESEPLHKVAIIPRGMALGSTMYLPKKDQYMYGKKKVLAEITTMMAGRVAEKLFCDDIHTGASNDLKRATDLARRMVCQWGMSDELGPVVYRDVEEHPFLGREYAHHEQISAGVSDKIDQEIRRIIDQCTARATEILSQNAEAVKAVVGELLKREILTAAEIDLLMKGQTLPELNNGTTSEKKPETAAEPQAEPKKEPGGVLPEGGLSQQGNSAG